MKAIMRSLRTALLCSALIFPFLAHAQVQPLGTVIGNQIVTAVPIAPPGYPLAQALVYYPDDYFLPANVNKRYPLYVFLHGAGEGATNNIAEVINTSLPQLISQGLKPYGIDPVTKDTIKYIVVSPHAASTGSSYYYPQLQYTIPYLFTALRVDTSCVWVGGLSAGGRGTWSVVMGNNVGDTTLGKRITGIMPMSNGGYDNMLALLQPNLDTIARRGLATLYTIGSQDAGYNQIGFFAYQATMKQNSLPGRYHDTVIANGTHSAMVWNPPFPETARMWSTTMNSWTQMWTMRKNAGTVPPPPPPTLTPPTVNAGKSQTITAPASSVTLSGIATPAGTTTITGLTWSETSGPAAVIANSTAASTTITGLTAGTCIFNLKAIASDGSSASSTVQVTVNAVTAPPPAPKGNIVTKVGCTEYKSAFLYSDSVVRSFNYNTTTGHVEFMPFLINGRKAVDVSTGFNRITILDDQGFVWLNDAGQNTATRWNTDTTGAAFNGNVSIYGYFFTYLSIRNDGSIWYWGRDDYKLFGGTQINQPIKIAQPAGVKFVKLATGNSIVGLTSTGDVYQWNIGVNSYVKVTLPRPASDIAASHSNFFLAVVPDNIATSTMGFPFAWGSESRYWGGDGSSYAPSAPMSLKALWNMSVPIKKITANQNVIHYIDANGDLFGIGDNPNGEIGNGQELVNHAEKYPTPYAWSWVKYEMLTGAPAIHVASGTRFKDIFTGSAYSFYHYALDANDSLYFWGRNKSFVGGDGVVNNQESTYPNALDILTPSMRTPLAVLPTQTTAYNFSMYTLLAPAKQSITLSTAILSATATPSALAASGHTNYGYSIKKYQWTKVSGPTCSITSPDSLKTNVTGLITGTYIFSIQTTDNNTGTITAYDTLMVNSPGVFIVSAGPDMSITLPTDSITIAATATVKAETVASCRWKQNSGPATAVITGGGSIKPCVKLLAQGTYSFQVTITSVSGKVSIDTMAVIINPATAGAASISKDSTAISANLISGNTTLAWQMYPNPMAKGQQVTIQGTNAIAGTVKITVYDLAGHQVKQFINESQSPYFRQTISLDGLLRGVYIVNVQSLNKPTPNVLRLVIE